ncbi:MAG: hypothetical protein GBAus27B_000508 [Mycoplasmataceae bacterium]|nr:MAG: hypothetical protein GBAus27B_000401 [Mycoplasmataceae bacterium]WNE40441.1 MAG: hypothetical protein GBAus27B_000508 [Mycoplasmataceae bacterium]
MSKPIKIKENITEINCQCQPLPQWVKWLAVILIIAIFIMACVQLHYLWKLADIWQAIKSSK